MKGAVMRKGRLYEMGSYTQRGLRGVHKKGGCHENGRLYATGWGRGEYTKKAVI